MHGGLSPHTHQVCCALLVVDEEAVTWTLNLRSRNASPYRRRVAELQ